MAGVSLLREPDEHSRSLGLSSPCKLTGPGFARPPVLAPHRNTPPQLALDSCVGVLCTSPHAAPVPLAMPFYRGPGSFQPD
jgi:hypothetical protein